MKNFDRSEKRISDSKRILAGEVSRAPESLCFAAGFALTDIIVSQMDRRGS